VDAIRALVRAGSITGVHLINDFPPFICNSCEYAKTTQKPICKERTVPRVQSFGDEVHTDVWGPSSTHSLGGRRYYVSFTDDATRYTRLQVLKTKDEAFEAYKSFAAWAQTQHGVHIRRLYSDRGGEFLSNQFTAYLRQQGTERRLTTADTPQHNGVAESLNHRLMERTCAILHHADLPKYLWAEAIQFAVWLKNCTSTKTLGVSTPHERLYNEKPNLGNVPEWGQAVWVYNPDGSKLDA
jgi:transposase InsO family protein